MTTVINTEQQVHTAELRVQVKKRSDKLMNYFLLSFFAGGLLLANFYDTWLVACGIGGLSLLAYYSAKKILPGSNLYQYVLAVVLGVFMAQYIYQMHGLFEMHFVAFIGSAVLITYQNWKLQIAFAATVVVHHGIFGYLQNAGTEGVYFTQLDSFELSTYIIHILLAAVIFFICGLWAYLLNKYSEAQAGQSMEVGRLQKEALVAATERDRQEELIRAQKDLAESNNRFSYVMQATSDAIWDHSTGDETISWGEGFTTLFGYPTTPENSSFVFWKSKIHPGDNARVLHAIKTAQDNPATNTWICQYRFLKADGEFAFVREKAVILRDEKGKPARMIGAVQDITEIRQKETALEELNEALAQEKYFLDSLMDNVPDSIYFKDRDSRLTRVSKYMSAKFGKNSNELIGKTDFEIHDGAHAAEAYNDEQEMIRTGVPKIDFIEKETMKDGTERWISSTKMPLRNIQGEIVGTFGISKNVTALKEMEQERHSALLDQAVAQGKFEIASNVMHDIGNAMVGFGSYLTRIRRSQEDNPPENLEQLASFFKEQETALVTTLGEIKAPAVIKMMNAMAVSQKKANEELTVSITEQFNIIAHIQEILNIQRQYISGHESQERKPVHLRNIVTDALSMLSASIDKMGISVSSDIPANLPAVKGDHTKLMQVILNLLKNSIESISMDSLEKNISLTTQANNGNLVLQVRDNGRGFDQEVLGQLFRRGFTTKSSGKGLGLYNCRSIIESHEGDISMSSEGKGKGSLAVIKFKV